MVSKKHTDKQIFQDVQLKSNQTMLRFKRGARVCESCINVPKSFPRKAINIEKIHF